MKKNLAIYVHNEAEGEVRDYIIYCLKGLQEVVSEILVVINGRINAESRRKLEKLGVKILIRENQGFDWWAWRAGIEYYGYDKIAEFDSLLLTNNTFYGPVYPFSEMWNEMESRDCDFWGINRHRATDYLWIKDDPNSKMLNHIQSYWLVFKNKILKSEDFKNYWENIKPHNNFEEMVGYGETKLTDYFEGRGFKSDTYMDFEKYDSLIGENPCFMTDRQVIEDRCPIIKRKYLYHADFNFVDLEKYTNFGPKRLLRFLQDNDLYDVSLIWKDLLKISTLGTLDKRLGLNFLLPSEAVINNDSKKVKVAVILYIYPLDVIDFCYDYAKNIPENIDIIIVNTNENVQNKCKEYFRQLPNNVIYFIQENRGRDNTALLVTCNKIVRDYDYVCFVHGKKSPYFDDKIVGEFFREHCFNSLLYSKNYIENIVTAFEKNPSLGVLVPFIPNTAIYKGILKNAWTVCYDKTVDFLFNKMKINAKMEHDLMCPIGGMYWFRTKALKRLFDYPWKFTDFPEEPIPVADGLLTHIIERSICLIAQFDGFYSAWVAPDFYASSYLNVFYQDARFEKPEVIRCIVQQAMAPSRKDIQNYFLNRMKYSKYRLMSHLTGGKIRKRYLEKRKKIKVKIDAVKNYK